LEKILNSEYEIKKLFKKLFSNEISTIKKLNFLDNFSSKEISKRLNKFDSEARKNIELILNNLNA
jgi:hypothetical protein